MANNYISDPKNPFFSVEDDDIDDETFLRNSRRKPVNRDNVAIEDHAAQLMERRREIEDRTVRSTEKSLSLLRDSEQIGMATAEELLRQREQLERTEKRLVDINNTLRFSQKHIQGIKSVFGNLKNYLSGKSMDQPPHSSSQLSPATKDNSKISSDSFQHASISNGDHPGLRIRDLDDSSWNRSEASSLRHSVPANQIIDRNLDEMCNNLSRLKGLAQEMGDEIETQNDLVDEISYKTERADAAIKIQNRDMNKLLKKK